MTGGGVVVVAALGLAVVVVAAALGPLWAVVAAALGARCAHRSLRNWLTWADGMYHSAHSISCGAGMRGRAPVLGPSTTQSSCTSTILVMMEVAVTVPVHLAPRVLRTPLALPLQDPFCPRCDLGVVTANERPLCHCSGVLSIAKCTQK
jgi:hypothetical protein